MIAAAKSEKANTTTLSSVMAGLVLAIHVLFCSRESKTWMPATSAGMTAECVQPSV